MRADNAGKQAYAHVTVPWDELRAARVQKRILAELREKGGPRVSSSARRRVLVLVAAACTFAALAMVVWSGRWPSSSRLEFADGTFIAPEASARVVTRLVSEQRIEVDQLVGAASYDVSPRSERTFVIHVGEATVEVLGTAFRIDRRPSSVHVTVQRGRVKVSRGEQMWMLGPGEEITLDGSERQSAVSASTSPSETAESSELALAPAPAPSASATQAPEPVGPTAAELFRKADDARASGNTGEALKLLRELLQRFPRDGRATLATFTVGRLERQRGNFAQAARAFEACGGALGGEALAEAALARAASGQTGAAKNLAKQYLALYPKGPRAGEVAVLAQ
jgi:transmembrane sensor